MKDYLAEYLPHHFQISDRIRCQIEAAPLEKISKQKLDEAFQFEIKGDLSGSCYIAFVLEDKLKELETDNLNFMHGLLIETCNIVLGNCLTEIENQQSLTCNLSSPTRARSAAKLNSNTKECTLHINDQNFPFYLWYEVHRKEYYQSLRSQSECSAQ